MTHHDTKLIGDIDALAAEINAAYGQLPAAARTLALRLGRRMASLRVRVSKTGKGKPEEGDGVKR